MKYKTIQIDCNNMSEKELNKTMKELHGFPDFYGMNWDAMIDCLSYMRYPHEQITELTLEGGRNTNHLLQESSQSEV